jgi:hypothetical protein
MSKNKVDPCFVGPEKTDRARRGSLRLCKKIKLDGGASTPSLTIRVIVGFHQQKGKHGLWQINQNLFEILL